MTEAVPAPMKSTTQRSSTRILFVRFLLLCLLLRRLLYLLFVHLTPVKISSVQCQDQRLGSCNICRNRNVILVAELNNIVDILFMGAWCKRISEENKKINIIIICHRSKHANNQMIQYDYAIYLCL